MKNKEDCCAENKNSWKNGLLYGLMPHSICILFIIASLLGATFLTQLLKPLLLNKYFFYGLILISLLMATISTIIYLRKNQQLSKQGIKKKRKYIALMYGLTIGINLLFFFVLLPILSGLSQGQKISNEQIVLKVAIPCPGHAPLINQELLKVKGVLGVNYNFPNQFVINYDSKLIAEEQILNQDIFKEFKAVKVN